MNKPVASEKPEAANYRASAGYYPSPWSGEDGGPQRLQAVSGLPGLAIKEGEALSSRPLAVSQPATWWYCATPVKST